MEVCCHGGRDKCSSLPMKSKCVRDPNFLCLSVLIDSIAEVQMGGSNLSVVDFEYNEQSKMKLRMTEIQEDLQSNSWRVEAKLYWKMCKLVCL